MKSRKPNRLKGFNYSSNNLYFVTLCVKNMECCLGAIVRTGCDLSVHEEGKDVGTACELSEQDGGNCVMQLNQYGLIVYEKILWLGEQYEYIAIHNYVIMPNHLHFIIEIDSVSVKDKAIKIKSLSELIGAFKTTSSKKIHFDGYSQFAWHRSFHDHIIRNETSYLAIFNYIETNPDRWQDDNFF